MEEMSEEKPRIEQEEETQINQGDEVLEKQSEKDEKNEKKRNLLTIILIVAIAAAAIAGGNYWYNSYYAPHNEAVAAYDKAVEELETRNGELDAAIAKLQVLMGSGEEPFDSSTSTAATTAISEAQTAKEDAPEMASDTDEINAQAAEIAKLGQYDTQLANLNAAYTNLEDSIAQMKQVTNPSEQFVLERITGLPNITGQEAVTETNDPNGKLNKTGGYTATIYFTSDLVNQDNLYIDTTSGYTGIPNIGAVGGGSIEVYATIEDANSRNEYLASFDGSFFSNGSHTIVGTCVIRVSDECTASQQEEVTQNITNALIRLDK